MQSSVLQVKSQFPRCYSKPYNLVADLWLLKHRQGLLLTVRAHDNTTSTILFIRILTKKGSLFALNDDLIVFLLK